MIGIYCRISKHKEQGRDVSIETQMESGIEFAKNQGLTYKTFVDRGVSGASDDLSKRPEFVDLLDSVRHGEVTQVYCYDQSRIERNTDIWNLFTHTMTKAGCLYYPNGILLDLNVLENKLFTGIVSLLNSFYAELTSRKVKLAITANAKKGKTHGMTAYGYEKGENGFFKINEEEAAVIRRIFQMSFDGMGTYMIAKTLNKEKIEAKFNRFNRTFKRKDKDTGKITLYNTSEVKWRGNVIHDIIHNPIYKGKRKWGKEFVVVPAIIEEEFWERVNSNLEENKKSAGKRDEYHYLLNGLLYCATCGKEYRGKKRLKGRDNAYKCKGKSNYYRICSSRSISIPKLENFIIHHLFISKELEKYLVGLTENKLALDELKTKLTNEKATLEKLKRAESKAYKLLLDPDYGDDEKIKEELKLTKKKIKDKAETIELLENKLIELDEKNRIDRIKKTIGSYNLTLGFNETKKLIHSLIKKITISYKVDKVGKNYFHLVIEYNGFDESTSFMTDIQALKWIGLTHHRSQAISEEDLKKDKELMNFLLKSKGHSEELPSDFKGLEVVESAESIIELNKDELIKFD